MFAVGHLSLGYLIAKGSAKLLNRRVNVPLVLFLSLVPDIDVLILGVQHRTITHSIIASLISFLPVFAYYRAEAVPYFLALLQHSLVGDFITGGTEAQGTQLFWPLTFNQYGLPIDILSPANLAIEWISFTSAAILILKTRDIHKLRDAKISNLLLSVPIMAVLLPSFLYFPLAVPLALLIPHIVYLTLFALSIADVSKQVLSALINK